MPNYNSQARLAVEDDFERLTTALDRVRMDVVDYCDDVREEAEKRIGSDTTEEVLADSEYSKALEIFAEIDSIRDNVHQFRTKLLGLI